MYVVNNFNCRGFGPLLEDKLCLIFKLAPSVCRMTFPILASLLVRLVVLLPFQLLRLSLATPSRWTPLALSVFLHCVVALLLTRSEERFSRNAETDLVCRLLLEKKKAEGYLRKAGKVKVEDDAVAFGRHDCNADRFGDGRANGNVKIDSRGSGYG